MENVFFYLTLGLRIRTKANKTAGISLECPECFRYLTLELRIRTKANKTSRISLERPE